MNLNQLKLFYLAIKRNSLTDAAAELNITQPAVTRGIKRLQEYYEIQFVERVGKKLVLTKAGQALYDMADKIFTMEKMAEERIRSFQVGQGRQIIIHTSESFGAYYLPAMIHQFQAANPAVTVKVDILPTDKVVDTTIALQNDIGFISCPVKQCVLIQKEILEESLVIIVSSGHRLADRTTLTPRDLEGEAMIMHEHGSAQQRAVDSFTDQHDVKVSKLLEFSNNEAIKRAVAEGDGIALISEKAADEEIRTGKLIAIPLIDPPVSRTFYLIHRKEKFISGPLANLLEVIKRWTENLRHVNEQK
jgi:DNA-binding transcriptional LysR family regulator